jgi:hypothetical protein
MGMDDVVVSTEQRAAELRQSLARHPVLAGIFAGAGWAPDRWVEIPPSFRRFEDESLEYEDHFQASAILHLFGGLCLKSPLKGWEGSQIRFEIGDLWGDMPARVIRSAAFHAFLDSQVLRLPVCEGNGYLYLVGETGMTLRVALDFYSFGLHRTFLGAVARNLGVPWEEGDTLEERVMTELEQAVLMADG